MDKKVKDKFMSCIKEMRNDAKSNWVIGLSSNDRYDHVSFLDIFRTGINSYTIKFSSPIEEMGWVHEDMYLKHAISAIETWYESLDNINRFMYFEY